MEKQDSKKEKAQPPPRKGTKVATALRNIHNEQLLKLQVKHQQDTEFMEDIRNFTKMRAIVEKEYATSLLKLATSYLGRKGPSVPEMKTESGDSYKTVYAVWRTLLDETEKIAKARLAAAEVYQQQVSESAKGLRLYKLQIAKKCFDNLRKMHEEIQTCVVEIDKSKKLYFEEEHMAHEARDKAHDADEKLKRKKGRIFQSISSLQKNSAKFSFRREACDIQATKARNDYVLALVAANAHQMKYYDVDLPELIQYIDCDIYDKVKEYVLLISRTELLTCAACQSAFSIVQERADMATKQYTMECFFHDNPVLSQALLYEFEPCDNDKINKLSIEHNAALCLSKEARRWASCVAKETRVVRDSREELKKLTLQIDDKPPFTICEQGPQAEIELRIDELRQIIRRAQTSKKKAEARLDAMRESGVNVDEWMRPVETESVSTDTSAEVFSRSGTVTSRASQRSYQSENYDVGSEANDAFYDSDNATEPPTSAPVDVTEDQFASELASAVDVVAAVQSAWDAAAEAEEEEEYIEPEPIAPVEEPPPLQQQFETEPAINGGVSPAIFTRCIAQFTYQASNKDELSFVELEELEIVDEGDGDGWIKARNCQGEEGYIPQNYVEIIESEAASISPQPPSAISQEVEEIPQEEEVVTNAVVNAVTNEEVVEVHPVPNGVMEPAELVLYCRATYDYEATCDEELTFFEDQIIRLIRKNVTDVDDGWWEGEMDGKIGLFPSLVVVELKESGELLTPVDIISPTTSFPPPAFTPPQAQQLLILPSQVLLTQPTPDVEHPPGTKLLLQETVAITLEKDEFHIEMSEKLQSHYQHQFSASDSESSEQEVPAPEEGTTKYAPLVPSPDSPTKTMATTTTKEAPLEKISEEKAEEKIENESSVTTTIITPISTTTNDSASAAADSDCPTVVITEAQFAHFDDEFIYNEEKNKPEGEITKEVVEPYQNPDTFECTFPDPEEVVPDAPVGSSAGAVKFNTSEPVVEQGTGAADKPAVEALDQDSKSEQDVDVKMEFNNDVVDTPKTQNDFFEVTG